MCSALPDEHAVPPTEWVVDQASNGMTDLDSASVTWHPKPHHEPDAYLTGDVVRALKAAGLPSEELCRFLSWVIRTIKPSYPNGLLRHLISVGEIRVTVRMYLAWLLTRPEGD